MTTIVEERELTLNDRCDSCQAAAKIVATFISGELLFCGHHARENKDSLTSKSIKVYDPEGFFDLVQ